ncbi:hypothetical protein D5086_017180 [Populus alba]|uniref:Uncharacterized protein n=2 Tax=Populus alba TaxID=43335 RepID=A0ACC4BW20_POPAL|nr:hypothetical protein D5086_0000146620 [Populus alba]
MAGGGSVQKTEEEWRAVLSPEQFHILRNKGTEPKFSGEYDKFFEQGVYNCGGCGTPLYKSTTKFNSGCGWPAFYEGLPAAINRSPDPDGRRTEITCAACGGIWVMYSRARVTRLQQTNAIVSTASLSSLFLLSDLLSGVN